MDIIEAIFNISNPNTLRFVGEEPGFSRITHFHSILIILWRKARSVSKMLAFFGEIFHVMVLSRQTALKYRLRT
jgi:hypothetical protein